MQASAHFTSTHSLLGGLLAIAACFSSTGASANLAPELATGMVQMAANLNHAAVACGEASTQKVESMREQQRTEFLKTVPKMSVAEYERLYAQASKEFQATWTSLSAAQKKQSCDSMKQMSDQATEALKSMPQ